METQGNTDAEILSINNDLEELSGSGNICGWNGHTVFQVGILLNSWESKEGPQPKTPS